MNRPGRSSRVTVTLAGLLAFSGVLAGSAAASLWSRAGSGAGSGRAGGVSAVTVTVPSSTVTNGTVSVSWTAATAPAGAAVTYLVDRKSGSTYTSVCGTGTTPTSSTSCSDASVPDGSYQYRVTATVSTNWATPSADSGTVSVLATPAVNSVSPASRGQNSAATTVTISGAGFTAGSGFGVSFGTHTTVSSVTLVNSTTITASVAVTNAASTGPRNVVVTNGGGATLTCSGCFTINAAPSITTVSGQPLPRNGAETAVTVSGTGFVTGFTPSITGSVNYQVISSSFVSSTQVTVTIKNNNTGNGADKADLTITNPDGGSVTKAQVILN